MQPGTSTIWQGLTPESASNIPTPSVGRILFHDSADGLLKSKDSSGDVVTIVQTDTSGVIVGPITLRNETETATNLITLLDGELAIISDTGQLRYGDGVQAGGFAGNMASSTTILCPAIGTPVENAARLRALYTEAKSYTPGGSAISATNRVVILLGIGTYDFGTGDGSNHGLELDTEFIDLVGITGKPEDVILTSAIATASRGTVEQTADDVRLSGFTMEITTTTGSGTTSTIPSAYFPSTALSNTKLQDIVCTAPFAIAHVYSMRVAIEYAGTYDRVTGGERSFGGGGGALSIASGIFNECICGERSFGGSGGIASGTFNECIGDGIACFGAYNTASGTFNRCTSGEAGFGGEGGTSSGTFNECIGGYPSYGTFTATTELYDCLLETGYGTGIYAYLPENTKRKNGTDSASDTGVDMTSTYTITWTNSTGYDLQVSSTLALSNLNTDAETFSVAVTSASGANTFTSSKPSGESTWDIQFPPSLGFVDDAANYIIEISTDNTANTSVNYTQNIIEQAVL